MKIAQVNVYFYPCMVGGAEWYVYNISRHLTKRGHEVHVFTANTYQGEKIGLAEDSIEGIHVHRIPLRLDLSYRLKVWRGLKNGLTKEKFDIIHTYDYAQSHSSVAIKVGMKMKIPTALTVFDVHSMIPRPFYKQLPMKILEKYYARATLRKASRILPRAPNLVDTLTKLGAAKEKIHVTPSGINEEALEPADGVAFLKEYRINGKPIILYLGRLHPTKGLEYLIKASKKIITRYDRATLVFVGPYHGGYKEKLVTLGQRLNVESHLIFTGPIYDFAKKMQAYASADVFVLPSAYEGTSQAVFEAMAQERPIVSTDRGGIPFQVENEKEAILVQYGDEKALATAILKLLNDKRLANSLGLKAKEKVKNFTYPILASQMESIYQDMLKH